MKKVGPAKRSMKDSVEVPSTNKDRVLVITDIEFLVERTVDGDMPEPSLWEISHELRDALLDRYQIVLIPWTADIDSVLQKGLMGKSGADPKIQHWNIVGSSPQKTTDNLIEALTEMSVRFSFPRNRSLVSWLNLKKYVRDKRIDFAGASDHAVLGFTAPKKKSFADSAQSRSRASKW